MRDVFLDSKYTAMNKYTKPDKVLTLLEPIF